LKTIMTRCMDVAKQLGAQYADMRIVHNRNERIEVKNGIVDVLNHGESFGFGVRILAKGAWGFASSWEISDREVDRVTAAAVEIAHASAFVNPEPVDLGPLVTSQGTYQTPLQVDPFSVSTDQKVSLLLNSDAEIAKVKGISTRRGHLTFIWEDKWFTNSEGAFIQQSIICSGGGIQALAVGEGEVQSRSHLGPLGLHQVTAGWEAVQDWDLPGNAGRIAEEAVALLSAVPCPTQIETTVILDATQVALQIHESCGHPIELDRVFGSEAAYAGTSFLTPDKLNSFQYGSPIVNITADSLRSLGLGTFGWDDEGIPAQSTAIVQDGIFVGYLMSRETAARLGKTSNGCMRASGWNRIPLVRMTNVSLEPGTWELDDLIADTDDGIYMKTPRSWSIDDRRYNFQFGTEIGYEIKNGKIGRILRNPTYTGITPQFWNNCDAICNQNHWTMWGTPNCGKGQPGQIAQTGHGAAPARFHNVKVGVTK
jgi:TldD protein